MFAVKSCGIYNEESKYIQIYRTLDFLLETNFSILKFSETFSNLYFEILVFVFVMSCMFVCGGQQRRYDGDPAEHKMASGFDVILLQRPFPNISY